MIFYLIFSIGMCIANPLIGVMVGIIIVCGVINYVSELKKEDK